MANIIIIEGLPGSGKTTFAQQLYDDLKALGKNPKRFLEGEMHPIDFAWIAVLTDEQYQALLKDYPEDQAAIKAQTTYENDKILLAYTRVRLQQYDPKFYEQLSAYEIYRLNDLATFLKMHIERIKTFVKTLTSNDTYIFECIFLQNHINELILKYHLSWDKMTHYFHQLYDAFSPNRPFIYHIEQAQPKATLTALIETRKPYRWFERVLDYFKTQPYGESLGYTGEAGFFQYFTHRQKMELKLLDELKIPMQKTILDDDYDKVYHDLKTAFLNRLDVAHDDR